MKKIDANNLLERWKHRPYKNTGYLIVSLVVFFYFADSDFVKNLISHIGALGYLGAAITGVFFVSVFTVAPAAAVLYNLADTHNPIIIALAAGLGAVLGDYLIFRFLRDRVFEELSPVFDKVGGSFLKKIFLTPYFAWLIPIAGAFIIASPLPDEAGIGLLGL